METMTEKMRVHGERDYVRDLQQCKAARQEIEAISERLEAFVHGCKERISEGGPDVEMWDWTWNSPLDRMVEYVEANATVGVLALVNQFRLKEAELESLRGDIPY